MASVTLSQEIAKALVVEIVSGLARPGARLDESSIAKRFKVSRTPVRDALRHLAASRLVEFAPRRGFSVAPIDRVKLQDAYEAFSEIEALCARLCALRAGMTERARLEVIHEEAKIAADSANSEHYALINDAFHDVIYAGSHNATLEKIALELRQQLSPFRSRVFFEMGNSQAEHDILLKAILSKDADAAADAMMRHTSRVALHVLSHISGAVGSVPQSTPIARVRHTEMRSRKAVSNKQKQKHKKARSDHFG